MQRLWGGLVTIGVLVLLFLPRSPVSEHSLPKLPWVLLLILTLTYAISLMLSSEVVLSRRLAIAYLVFTGSAYFLAGVLGLLPNWDIIEASAWDSLISPYLLVSFFGQLVRHFPYTVSRAPYATLPMSDHRLLSAVVIAVSTVAIVAAFGMAKSYRIAYRTWLVLLVLLAVATAGYVVVGLVSWGSRQTILPLCWETSYIVAYVIARKGVALR